MATKKPAAPAVKPSASRAVANWDEELAKQAAAAAETEASTATSQMFGLKAGVLTWNDAPLQNNEMAAIIVDSVLENVHYPAGYDEDNPSPPDCFAFGRDDKTMAPHADVVANGTAQSDACRGCELNKFGSADRGKGKACSNRRRLALIPGGVFAKDGRFTPESDPEVIQTAQLGFMRLPVMSVKGFAAHVKGLAGTLKRPPHGVFTKIKVIPDTKSQFLVTFETLGVVPNTLMAAIMARRNEAVSLIEQPYNLEVEERPVRGPVSRNKKPVTKRKF